MRVTFAEIATARPMGQQAYERAIQEALAAVADPELAMVRLRVTSMRNPVPAERRVPWRLLQRMPVSCAAAVGAYAYRGGGLVHRLDLRLPPAAGPEVVTAHDLPGLRFPDEGAVPAFLAAGTRRARAIIVPSRFAGQELVELLGVDPARLHVIPYGLNPVYSRPPAEPTQATLRGLTGRTVVHAAGATQRKNLASLAQAWREVTVKDDTVELLLCGPEDVRRTSLFAGLPRVRLLGRLSPGDVGWLMHRAAAVVVPSTYEGFGLPALEGMASGTPVVASARGALPEVCADAALLVEPDADSLAAGLLQVLGDRLVAQDLRRRGLQRSADFSWHEAALRHLDVYRACS